MRAGFAAGVDGVLLGGEDAVRSVGGVRAPEAGEAGAADGVGEGLGGAGFWVGDADAHLPPMGLMGLIGRMGFGDAVGAGEVTTKRTASAPSYDSATCVHAPDLGATPESRRDPAAEKSPTYAQTVPSGPM